MPVKYLYPSRSPVLRGTTVGLGCLWGVAILALIYQLPHPSAILIYASLAYPAYYAALSLWLWRRRR